jgi:hypothetical protein
VASRTGLVPLGALAAQSGKRGRRAGAAAAPSAVRTAGAVATLDQRNGATARSSPDSSKTQKSRAITGTETL